MNSHSDQHYPTARCRSRSSFVRSTAHLVAALLLFAAAEQAGAYQNTGEALQAAREKAKAKDFAGAMKDADQAILLAGKETGRLIDALLFQAQTAEQMEDLAKAMECLEKVLEEPVAAAHQLINATNRKAALLQKAGKAEEAERVYQNTAALEAFRSPVERARLNLQLAAFYERSRLPDKAVETYDRICNDQTLSPRDRLGALSGRATLKIKLQRFDEARADYQEAMAVPDLRPQEKVSLQLAIAESYRAAGDLEKAALEFEKRTKIEGLTEQEIKRAAEPVFRFYRSRGDHEAMKRLLDSTWPGTTAENYPWLRDYARLAEDSGLDAEASQAWAKAFALPGLPAASFAEAGFARLRLLAKKRSREEMAEVASRLAENGQIAEEQRFAAELIQLGLSRGKDAFAKKSGLPKTGADAERRVKAYDEAGKIFVHLGEYELARNLAQLATGMFLQSETPVYDCRFVSAAPVGVSGWADSGIVKDPVRKESRFSPYNEAAAAKLIYDVNVARNVSSKTEAGSGNVAFYMAADARGWHLYVDYKEEEAEQVMAGLLPGGSLEIYFTPGEGRAYKQLMVEVPSGKLSSHLWSSPSRNERLLDQSLEVQVAPVGEGFGIWLFIPWTVLYDKLPKEGESWQFGLVNFGRKGSFTWGSGQVHEMHRFGRVRFVGIDQQMDKIKRRIVMKAFGRYKESARAVRRFWNDEVKGDRAFFENAVAPELARLDEQGKKVKADMGPQECDSLFANAVPDWMELDYLIAEARTRYLMDGWFATLREEKAH